MTGILDRVAKASFSALQNQFRPATPEHFLALRLAERLNDAPSVHHYIELADRYGEGPLLAAYRLTVEGGAHDLPRRFHAALKAAAKDIGGLARHDLAAIRIERRAIAVAIFEGDHLKYPPLARHLSSNANKAVGSAASFINRIRDKCSFENAAVEMLPPEYEVLRSELARVIREVLEERQVAVIEFAKAKVLAAFGHPRLRFRNQVREVMSAMWPEVNGEFGSPLIKDALALGLYCQTEHILSFQN